MISEHFPGLGLGFPPATTFIQTINLFSNLRLFKALEMKKKYLQNGKIADPPSRQGKTFRSPPPFKEWKLFCIPPFNIANTSSYLVKNTLKLVVPPPPSAWLKLFLSSPPPIS